ncbi:MAG: LysM peptidoglycan-binding domain-containing protein [Rickettsiaceae bacterium]|nr:MAG: LysM peptidoglycan-binding domain-containing protein [Rickettsiaceae bacterium]
MKNIDILAIEESDLAFKSYRIVTYLSILAFIIFAAFATLSIKKYVNNTLSITLIEPEISASSLIEEETTEESSVVMVIKSGDTISSILNKQKLSSSEFSQIMKILKDNSLASSLQIGQKIIFDYEPIIIENDKEDLVSQVRSLNKITLLINNINSLEIIKVDDSFILKNTSVPLNKNLTKLSAVINSSLTNTLKSLKIPTNNVIEIIDSYKHQVDFQRQIKPGDKINIVVEKFTDKNDTFMKYGKIIHASLILSGKEYNIYRYSTKNNDQVFFSEDGTSMKRSLLKTPLNIIRISSHYGNRKDPFLGYTKMHKGVDFSAPEGTPINAAGNGTITELGWRSGYGNVVHIKHSPTLTTVYAHASRFAKNLKVGNLVKQGQVVAYVGKTGKATSAHLHYEVKIDGKHINPMSVKTTPGFQLAGEQLSKFVKLKSQLKAISADNKNIKVAETK